MVIIIIILVSIIIKWSYPLELLIPSNKTWLKICETYSFNWFCFVMGFVMDTLSAKFSKCGPTMEPKVLFSSLWLYLQYKYVCIQVISGRAFFWRLLFPLKADRDKCINAISLLSECVCSSEWEKETRALSGDYATLPQGPRYSCTTAGWVVPTLTHQGETGGTHSLACAFTCPSRALLSQDLPREKKRKKTLNLTGAQSKQQPVSNDDSTA